MEKNKKEKEKSCKSATYEYPRVGIRHAQVRVHAYLLASTYKHAQSERREEDGRRETQLVGDIVQDRTSSSFPRCAGEVVVLRLPASIFCLFFFCPPLVKYERNDAERDKHFFFDLPCFISSPARWWTHKRTIGRKNVKSCVGTEGDVRERVIRVPPISTPNAVFSLFFFLLC